MNNPENPFAGAEKSSKIDPAGTADTVSETGNSAVRIREYYRPKAAAEYLGISQSTLAKLRMRNNRKNGPRFSKQGGCVVYRTADLDAWIEANIIESGCSQ